MPRFKKRNTLGRMARRRARNVGRMFIPQLRKRILGRGMSFKNPTHVFKRTCDNTQITTFATASSGGGAITMNNGGLATISTGAFAANGYYSLALGFNLADLPDVAEFTTLFDRYKLLAVKLKILPVNTMSALILAGAAAGNAAMGGFLHVVTDYDDATNFPASQAGVSQMREYENYKCYNLADMRVFKRYVKPRMAVAAYGAGFFTSYANARNIWIDCNSSSVPHFGIKLVWEIFNPNGNVNYYNFKIEATYYIALKDVR